MERCRLQPVEFTEMIGVSWRQGERYREGNCKIPDPVAKLIRTIIKHDFTRQDVG